MRCCAPLRAAAEAGGSGDFSPLWAGQNVSGCQAIPAAERGHVETVDTLIKAGVKVDHVNRLGWTALLEAIILGDGGERHQKIVALLIEAGANVNLADNDGVTPLQHARGRGYDEIASLLQKAGAK